MRDDPSVTDLVTSARNGDKQAWDGLVERYAPLIWSLCHRYRLSGADAEAVGQAVWMHLVEHLDNLRDPHALPGWLATTTRRECCRVLRATCKLPADGQMLENMPDQQTATAEHELLVVERNAALRVAFARLPRAASNCSPCSSLTLRCPTPRSAPGSASRSEASGLTATATWTGCAATRQSPA
jgi:RNA polymerase sigma factor (sigma-70 family)